jgi:hypothetical protein
VNANSINYWEGLPLDYRDPQLEEVRFPDKAELVVYDSIKQQHVIYQYRYWDPIIRNFKYCEIIADLEHSLAHSPLYQPTFVNSGAQFYRIIPVKSPVAQLTY